MAVLTRLLPLLLAAPLAAQPVGAWKLATQPDLPRIIEEATAKMNFLVRPIARGRLKKTNAAYQHITIASTPAEITIKYDDREPQHMPASGQPVSWKREDGEVFKLSARTEHGDLIQTYKAEDGERVNQFHLDPGSGVLSLLVTVTSHKLPSPVIYTLTYKGN
jgi:hypothetical protein